MKRVWVSIAALVVAGAVFGGFTVFAWMIDETHFDRPDEGFNRLAAQIERTPGVSVEGKERWVEAPTFFDPNSWIQLTVDEDHLPVLLATACASDYPDAVMWSLRVPTEGGTVISLHSSTTASDHNDTRCPEFGFDAIGLVRQAGRSAPGLDLQASIWDNGRFALVVLDGAPASMSDLIPLVAHAPEIREAAGLDPGRSIEINANSLGLVIPPREHLPYVALLTQLAQEHGVTSYWADGGGSPVDGIDKLQISAPERNHAAIEEAIRTSGLHVADFPVRFIPDTLR